MTASISSTLDLSEAHGSGEQGNVQRELLGSVISRWSAKNGMSILNMFSAFKWQRDLPDLYEPKDIEHDCFQDGYGLHGSVNRPSVFSSPKHEVKL